MARSAHDGTLKNPRPIMGRVVDKSRVLFYGTASDNQHYPVQAHLYICMSRPGVVLCSPSSLLLFLRKSR